MSQANAVVTLDTEHVKTLQNRRLKTSVYDIWQEIFDLQKYTCTSKLKTEAYPEIFKFYETSLYKVLIRPTLSNYKNTIHVTLAVSNYEIFFLLINTRCKTYNMK